MPQTADTNRRVVLSERPNGLPDAKTLQLEHGEVPTPGAGQVLLRTRYLSLDPYMRGRMNDAKSYAEPVKLGEVMTGQVVAEVLQSNCEGYALGDHVLAGSGWQDYALSDGADLRNLGQAPQNPSWYLGILGMPAYTAYAGLLEIGAPQPGETIVVAAASGPVGATVGQIAKSIIFRRIEDDVAVLVVTSGDRRVDEAKVAALRTEGPQPVPGEVARHGHAEGDCRSREVVDVCTVHERREDGEIHRAGASTGDGVAVFERVAVDQHGDRHARMRGA